ncbi:MAG: D-glycerate dehydrogenase [Planctomycetota bacterium]
MSEKRVVITRKIPGVLEMDGVRVETGPPEFPERAALLERVSGADAIVAMYADRVDAEMLDAAGDSLECVCNFAVGYDNVDLGACRERGVIACNTPDAVTEGTADLAWALILAVARRVVEADRFTRTRDYPEGGPLGMAEWLGADLTGRTLLVVGGGRIGFATAMRSLGWGMKVLYTSRERKWNFELAPLAAERVELDEGLARADVVSINCALNDETRGLIDAHRLGLMKPGAILVNTARGPIVDEGALVEALAQGRIWGAGLDVFEREPEVHPGLIASDRCVLTPHIGSAARRYREMMTEIVARNVNAVFAGKEPPNRIA